jgi:hypothetical protein
MHLNFSEASHNWGLRAENLGAALVLFNLRLASFQCAAAAGIGATVPAAHSRLLAAEVHKLAAHTQLRTKRLKT